MYWTRLTSLCCIDVEVTVLQELVKDRLDVFTNIACLRKNSAVRHSEGHIQVLGQCLSKKSFAYSAVSIDLVRRNSIPQPVGPRRRMLLFSNSMLCSLCVTTVSLVLADTRL